MIPKIEGLYLLHTFTCISNNQSIYKIGRSHNLYKRISSYSNGSICYLVIECLDSKTDEATMIKLFNNKYKNIKFYGKEYFEGDKNDMLQTIKAYVNNKYNYPRIIDKLFDIMIYDKNNKYIESKRRTINKLFSKKKYAISQLTIKEYNKILETTQNAIISNVANVNNTNTNTNSNSNSNNNNNTNSNNNTNFNNSLICNNCNKIFKQKWQLARHNTSKRKCKKPAERKEYKCKNCNNKYSTISNMTRHKNTCISKQSIQKDNLNNNPSSEHPIQPYDNKESNIIIPDTMYLLKYDDNDENKYIYDLVNSFDERNFCYITDDEIIKVLTSKNIIIEGSKLLYSNPKRKDSANNENKIENDNNEDRPFKLNPNYKRYTIIKNDIINDLKKHINIVKAFLLRLIYCCRYVLTYNYQLSLIEYINKNSEKVLQDYIDEI